MKMTTVLTATAATAVLATGVNANANTITYGGTQVNQPYVGLKVGRVSDNFEKAGSYETTAYGVYGGYNFDQHFGAEAEYLMTSKKELIAGSGIDHKAQMYGAYGTYRFHLDNTPFYAKAKAGVAKVEEKLYGANGSIKNADTGFAYGLGAGYEAGNFAVEASFERPHKDVDFISVGATFKF